ncbi:MAG: hypothetical protein AAB486_02715 [Patescibacteria group bacterium]
MARQKFSLELLEFVLALKWTARMFPEAPHKEGFIGGFPDQSAGFKEDLRWLLRMELAGYNFYTIRDGQCDVWWRKVERVIREFQDYHPDLLSEVDARTKYIFIRGPLEYYKDI